MSNDKYKEDNKKIEQNILENSKIELKASTEYNEDEYFYILLEMRKVFENHNKISTFFLHPKGRFHFYGIFYKENVRKFEIKKSSITDTWKIKFNNENDFCDLKCTSIYNSLLPLIN